MLLESEIREKLITVMISLEKKFSPYLIAYAYGLKEVLNDPNINNYIDKKLISLRTSNK